jgi:P4 family phage/plasmid primase-like protien
MMDDTKKLGKNNNWKHITADNFKDHINPKHNGVALLTGHTHFMIDIDFKHNVPEYITQTLKTHCRAYERTPGGYHFYFLVDERTQYLRSSTERYWNNTKIQGMDFRTSGGISYISPSNYLDIFGNVKRYEWEHGNLSTAMIIPDEIFEAIYHPDNFTNSDPTQTTEDYLTSDEALSDEKWIEVVKLVEMLSPERATDYSTWRDVIFSLRHTEYSDRMLELCHTFSKKSYKYDARSVTKIYYGGRPKERKLTIKSLYYWAKKDSPNIYLEFKSKEKSVENHLFLGTNASIADLFYESNPHIYIFSSVEGWYILQDNNTWLATGSKEIKSIPNILNTIREECRCILWKYKNNLKIDGDDTKYKSLDDTNKRIGSSSFIKGVAEFLQGKYYIKDIENKFNENKDLLAFNNGVFNTKTFEFRKTDPEDYITITTGYDYRTTTESEKNKVKQFLSKIFPSNYVLIYNLCALSTILTGHNFYEFFHIFTGTGANGKSLLMDLCKLVLGEYFKTISVSYLTKDNDGKDKTLPELVLTRYARMLVASEPEERDKFQTSFMKTITGNDEISCRGLYGKPVKFVPHFKLWILANDVPKFTKYDNGIERRTRCVHFPTRFVINPRNENEEKRDDFLKEKIVKDESWKYGLLGLLIDALKSLQGKTLEMPKEVEEFTEKYLLENNPVGAWIKKYYERTNNRNDIIQRTDLYNQFIQDTGINKTQKSFSDDMIKCYINNKTLKGRHYYYGIVRKEVFEEED